MQNYDQFKLLYNHLWLHKSTQQLASQVTPKSVTAEIRELPIKETPANPAMPVEQLDDTRDLLVDNPKASSVDSSLINDWETLVQEASICTKCKLCNSRRNVVIERGSRSAKWMFVGEGPGEQEDIQGRPFVGASGQLLQKMIAAMKLDPATDVYICNVVKCRPPSNRNPEPEEIKLCRNYLFSQIELVKPKIIITLGRFAHQTLLNTESAVGKLRLKQHFYKSIPLVVTYHPAYLLRNPSAKKDAWADLQLAMKIFSGLQSEN